MKKQTRKQKKKAFLRWLRQAKAGKYSEPGKKIDMGNGVTLEFVRMS